ncbi:sodium-dependent bicarbonate transport family permease [Salinarimonas rosea]|uniref:sodium-dependent bicarbonate transport family permease n=1 Tax=Salinarimonas rosea TaxID=552063 RepID=UPI00040B2E1D|nr:sodium-dependent bicarbonate transport family permease [Salinarimonas rosea]
MVLDFLATFLAQLQKPTLAFLIGGMVLAALGSRFEIPDAIYRFVVALLLLRIGLGAGIEIREAELAALAVPALVAAVLGVAIVLIGRFTLARMPGVRVEDGVATAGLFGAVSASTLAAGMVILDGEGVAFEGWVPALYPFMDIPALVTAIVLAQMHRRRKEGDGARVALWPIVVDSLRGAALSALLLGLAIGLLARPESVYESFYDPLFRGLLSILMLVMGMEAYSRLAEMRRVAHVYAAYAIAAPLVHGLLGFGLGWVAHVLTGFSPGGVVLLAVMAASSSDISGPPTLRAAIPTANPSTYVGSSTGIGTPVALLSIPLWLALAQTVFPA